MRRPWLLTAWLVGCAAGRGAPAPPPGPEGEVPTAAELDRASADGPRPERLVRVEALAARAYAAHPGDPALGWRWARALHWLGRYGEASQRAEVSGRCLERLRPKLGTSTSALDLYHLALCAGARAEAAPLEGLAQVKLMLTLGERALAQDPNIEHAGPERLLGALYLYAPAWPTSVGDLDQALEFLARAAARDPSWPENHLLHAEALLEDGREDEAWAALARAQASLDHRVPVAWARLFTSRISELRGRLQPKQMR